MLGHFKQLQFRLVCNGIILHYLLTLGLLPAIPSFGMMVKISGFNMILLIISIPSEKI